MIFNRVNNIFASLNDCLYRNMYQFQNLIFVDVDEFIIPRLKNVDNLQQLIQEVNKKSDKIISSLNIQNVFFYDKYPDNKDIENQYNIHVLKKTERKSKIWTHKYRSKYICIGRYVEEVGLYFVWQFIDGINFNVPSSMALLHHYRNCQRSDGKCDYSDSVQDLTVLKFKDTLEEMMKFRFKNFGMYNM